MIDLFEAIAELVAASPLSAAGLLLAVALYRVCARDAAYLTKDNPNTGPYWRAAPTCMILAALFFVAKIVHRGMWFGIGLHRWW